MTEISGFVGEKDRKQSIQEEDIFIEAKAAEIMRKKY